VFSQSEKDQITAEYELYTQRKEPANAADNLSDRMVTDPFAEQLLVSTQNSGLRNVSSRSVILAPFNSTISNEITMERNRHEIAKLLVPRRCLRFKGGKLGEINRQYELNNNAELDNGVYHMDSNRSQSRLATSFGKEQLES